MNHMSSQARLFQIGMLGLLVIAPLGCGSGRENLGLVNGTLSWNNKPVPGIQIMFVPDEERGTKGKRSLAVTDENGHFQLLCDNGQPGAVIGFHKVVLMASGRMTDRSDLGQSAAGKSKADAKPVIPPEFSNPNSTPVKREVKPGSQTIDLDLP
jgi:hypothetical protein